VLTDILAPTFNLVEALAVAVFKSPTLARPADVIVPFVNIADDVIELLIVELPTLIDVVVRFTLAPILTPVEALAVVVLIAPLRVVKPVTVNVLARATAPVTLAVPDRTLLPVTYKVFDRTVFPVTLNVFDSVAAPVTDSVPSVSTVVAVIKVFTVELPI
jgi:hypothetical protein